MKKLLAALLAFLLAAYALFHVSRSRTFQIAGEIIPRVDTSQRIIALTFDDGPTAKHTPSILQTLREKNVRATFFVTGSEATDNPEALREIVTAGHEIGNHSWSHRRMVFKSPAFIAREITNTDAAIRAAGYRGDIHFRAPYCKKLLGVPLYLARKDRKHITWDVEPETDPEIDKSADRIVDHVLAKSRPGSIVLLHPMYDGREQTRRALPRIIDGLRARGYRLVTVSELLRA